MTAMPDDINLPEPVAYCLGAPHLADSADLYLASQFTPEGEHADEWTPLYTADQLRAVISAALASRPYKLPPMPAVFQHMPPLPPPFRAGGQQIADDGNDKVFCDLWERGQVEAHARAAVEADRAQRKPLTDEQVYGVVSSIGPDVMELAKQWADNEIHSYSLAHQAEVLAAEIVRRTEAAHGIPAPKGGSDAQA